MGGSAVTPKRACRKCYGHAISKTEALAAGDYLVAPTGTVHKPSDEEAGKTECGVELSGGWDTSHVTAVPVDEQGLTPSGRRPRRKHVPPSGRRS